MAVFVRGLDCPPCMPTRCVGTCACTSVYARPIPCRVQRPLPVTCWGTKPPPMCCCYDMPCKADCFNANAYTRPSGRYARTILYPGECCPKVPPCANFTCPSPPYHPCCYHTCNKHV